MTTPTPYASTTLRPNRTNRIPQREQQKTGRPLVSGGTKQNKTKLYETDGQNGWANTHNNALALLLAPACNEHHFTRTPAQPRPASRECNVAPKRDASCCTSEGTEVSSKHHTVPFPCQPPPEPDIDCADCWSTGHPRISVTRLPLPCKCGGQGQETGRVSNSCATQHAPALTALLDKMGVQKVWLGVCTKIQKYFQILQLV